MIVSRGNQLPPWVNTSLTATELDHALKNHITKIMEHFQGKLYAIDVIVCAETDTLRVLAESLLTKTARMK